MRAFACHRSCGNGETDGRTRDEVEPLIAQQGATPLVYYKGAEFYSEADFQRVKAEIEADEGRKHPRRDEEAGIF